MSQTAEIIHGDGFDAKVIRTDRRKSASVKVVEGNVSISVPRLTSQDSVTKLLQKKTRWIKEKLAAQKAHPPPKKKEYVSGECFNYLGRNYRLKVISGQKTSVKLISGRLVVQVPEEKKTPHGVKNALIAWYREHALIKLQEKGSRYAEIVGVEPKSVSVKTFKSRWGSCSTKGDVVFNWKIIMAPSSIVDYVVVHELCHLIRHDHSPAYWKQVERVLPDYESSKDWLKLNGRLLEV